MKGYIYKITNQVNGKVYIGQTRQSVESRWNQHKSKARKHVDGNNHFHNAINKYGENAFKVEILEACNFDKLDSREIFYIAKYNSFEEGYNTTLGGGGKRVPDVYNKYEEIKDLYLSGFSSNWIAEKFEVDKTTIIKILKGLCVKIRNNQFKINRYELDRMIDDYNNGCSLKELAKRYDVCSHTIKAKLLECGVDVRKRSLIINDEEKQQQLIEDYLSGVSASELVKRYFCEWSTFKKILSMHNVKYDNKRDIAKVYNLTKEDFIEISKLLKQGNTITEIAKIFNVSSKAINSLLKKYAL